MGLLDELKQCGYEVYEEDNKKIVLYRSQYLDNGYGTYFDAEITLEYDKQKEEITEIWLDDMTEKELDQKLQEEISKCAYMKKHNCCAEELILDETEELDQDCTDCVYLTMLDLLMESLDCGNW